MKRVGTTKAGLIVVEEVQHPQKKKKDFGPLEIIDADQYDEVSEIMGKLRNMSCIRGGGICLDPATKAVHEARQRAWRHFADELLGPSRLELFRTMLRKLLLTIAILFAPAMALGHDGEQAHPYTTHHHHTHGEPGHTILDHYNGPGHYKTHFSPYVSPFAYGYYARPGVYNYGYYNMYRYRATRLYTHGYVYRNGKIYAR